VNNPIAMAYVLALKFKKEKNLFWIIFIYCRNIQSKLLQAHNLNPVAIAYVLAMKFRQCKHILRRKKILFLLIVETFKVSYCKYTILLLSLMF
jgi:hypothetical protein